MRREPEFFGDDELELVQLSRRLREALDVEEALTSDGVDHLVETGEYVTRLLFLVPRRRVGAWFYVRPGDAPSARRLLAAKGFVVVEVDEDEDEDEDEDDEGGSQPGRVPS